ncbi:MAG TPA: lamin tail domain-containing protein [Pyrinomonadaceae bacterium]|nr:lamin tail domain-containing protein [Pyrinomonadaceae bacterium]
MSSLTRFCGALAATLFLGLTFSAFETAQAQNPSSVLITEFRFRGPDPDGATTTASGANDEFVEIYNNTDGPLNISNLTLVSLQAAGNGTNTLATAPANTTIPPRGHYLFTLSTGTGLYSLSTYAASNQSYTTGIGDNTGIALCLTNNLANCTGGTFAERLDAVAFTGTGTARPALTEGTGIAPGPAATVTDAADQFSYVRRFGANGFPQDTNNNSADFVLISATGDITTSTGSTAVLLGAPGPENSTTSPVQRNNVIKASLIDPAQPATASPNRVRSSAGANPTTAAFGTLSIQRRFTNTTPDPITRLRFRVVDITTLNSPVATAPQADLRVLSSSGTVTNSAGQTVATVTGLTLEEPPTQPIGGGYNSSLTVIPPNGSLASGNTIDVQFLLGVQQEGNFRFLVNVEALPATSSIPVKADATKAGASGKARAARNQ